MKMTTRLIRALSAALLVLPLAQAASAQDYPSRPIKLVVPYAPGALNDTLARTLAEGLAKRLGQSVIVENKAGAAAQLGTDFVSKAPADGYTLLMGSNEPLGVLPAVKKGVPYAVPRDFSFVARVSANIPWVIVSSTRIAPRTLREFIDYARAHPGAVRYGSNGIGSGGHLAFALLGASQGVQLTHIPYNGTAPLVNDLLAGHIDAGVTGVGTMVPLKDSDKIKLLAVTTDARHSFFPDVPTTKEAGAPGVLAEIWFGIVGPAKMPAPIVERLSREIAAVLEDDSVRKTLHERGMDPAWMGPRDFQAYATSYVDGIRAFAESPAVSKLMAEETK
jgi:tripartite-type tricarboxylate transporter receptor subunit TctC